MGSTPTPKLTDSSDDRRCDYHTPFPRGDTLRIFHRADNTFACPVYPGTRHRWGILNEVKDHVLGPPPEGREP
uniref:Uncharacterized protein n=1 Tax=Setaria italica TaxID=4555 RepID=K3ZD10_SETIT